uniref:Uncharacterized protein n=1 Tax=Oryza brachyantha TaxID=4533 RepID=J3N1R8_ORYBR
MRGAAASPLLWKMKRLLNIGSEREIKKAIRLINGLAAAMIQDSQKLGVGNSHDLLSRFMAPRRTSSFATSSSASSSPAGISALTTLFVLLSKPPAHSAGHRPRCWSRRLHRRLRLRSCRAFAAAVLPEVGTSPMEENGRKCQMDGRKRKEVSDGSDFKKLRWHSPEYANCSGIFINRQICSGMESINPCLKGDVVGGI